MLNQLPSHGVPRRVFLLAPFALAGLAAVVWRKEHPIPDPRAAGSGPPIDIVVFSDNGNKRETVHVNKIEKRRRMAKGTDRRRVCRRPQKRH